MLMEVGSIRHLNIGLVGSTLNRNVICDQQGLGRLEVKAQHRVCEIIRARVYAQGHILAKDDHGICEHMTLQEVDLQTQASMLMCLVSFCGLCGPLYGPQRTFIPVNSTCHASDL